MTDETDRPGGRRRGTRMAVIGATVALGLAGLGVAASRGVRRRRTPAARPAEATTAYTQAQDTAPQQQQAPGRGDCPGMGQGGGQQGSGSGSGSSSGLGAPGTAPTPS